MHPPGWNISMMLLFSFDRNLIAFLLVHIRVLVQSWVWICAPLHKQITGECGGQSPAVCLQGPGVHPGTRVSQVPLQRGAGQVSRGRIMTGASGSSGCSSAIPHFHHAVCLSSLWPPHQRAKPALFSQRHQRSVKLRSWRAERNPSPPPAAPPWPLKCANSGFVQDADPWCPLGRLSTDQSQNPSICHAVSTSVAHTLQLYPWVGELMAFFSGKRGGISLSFEPKSSQASCSLQRSGAVRKRCVSPSPPFSPLSARSTLYADVRPLEDFFFSCSFSLLLIFLRLILWRHTTI